MNFVCSSVKFRRKTFFYFVQLLSLLLMYLSFFISEMSIITYHQVNLIV